MPSFCVGVYIDRPIAVKLCGVLVSTIRKNLLAEGHLPTWHNFSNQHLMKANPKVRQYHLQVQTELEALKDVLQWFEGLVFPLVPQKMGWQCEVALVEAFTNAVRHAHKHLPKTTPIDLEVKLLPHVLEMRIWDCGESFDLQAKLRKGELEVDSMDKEGGRGLQFIKKLTDELQYLNLPNNRNCLVMRKKYT